MKRAILILQQEHNNLNQLLILMRKLAEEMADGEAPDLLLLQEIGAYVSGYPELCHHPKEDLIFRRLQETKPGAIEKGADLLAEHERLTALIDAFNTSLLALSDDPATHSVAFASCMSEVVDAYEHHMEMEEKYFFPTAARELTSDDWAAIDYAVSEQDDPLFDAAISKYAKLRDEIFRTAARHEDRINTPDEGALSDLSSIADFNTLMQSRGIDVTLNVADSAVFQLVENGQVIFEIPASSEQRAAWCAFSYVAGRGSK